jgi:hypothetical protein
VHTVEFSQKLKTSILQLEKWVEDRHFKGYEPFDGLSSILRPLAFRSLFLERLFHERSRLYGLGLPANVHDHEGPGL